MVCLSSGDSDLPFSQCSSLVYHTVDHTLPDLVMALNHSDLKVALHNGKTIIEGPLHGRVSPNDCMWAIAEHDPRSKIRGTRLVLALEKTYGHRELWCTVFDREYLRKSITVEEEKEPNYNYIIKED